MRGWLEPLGSEDRRTYWVRRGLVILAALVLVAAVVGTVLALRPKDVEVAAPAATATPSSPAPDLPTPGPTTSSAEATAAGATPTPSTAETAAGAGTTAATPATTASAAASPTGPATPTACDPADLRLTVVGAPKVKSTADEPLTLGIVNGGKTACVMELKQGPYELKITSGSDLIFTSAHCKQWVGETTKTLKPEEAHEWQVVWNTRRSKPECDTTGDYLKPGTYVAQTTWGAAAPGRLVIQLQG